MGKRPARDEEEDMEIDAIKQTLKHIEATQKTQNETLKEVLILLRGSVAMGVNGILEDHKAIRAQLVEFAKGLADMERWKTDMTNSKGKITITLSELFTKVLAIIGGIGSIVGIALTIKQLLG